MQSVKLKNILYQVLPALRYKPLHCNAQTDQKNTFLITDNLFHLLKLQPLDIWKILKSFFVFCKNQTRLVLKLQPHMWIQNET